MPTWSEFPSKALWTASIITQMPSMPRTASLVNRPSSSMLCFARSPPIWSRCAPNAANLALENVAQKTINYLPNLAKKCIPHHTETGRKRNPKCALTSCHSGLTLIVLFGGNRQVKSFSSALLRLLGGLGSLFDISKIFGDALSYLRLFALGLASASLAITFNQIASQIGKSVPGLGILLAIIILLVGHTMNLLLGIMSGFVHGLRLNYIEFFKWAITEEGYPFIAFRKKEVKS